MQNRCISCGFKGKGFEEIVRNLRVVSSKGILSENMIQGDILLKCPKCGYEKKGSYGFSTQKKLGEKIYKKDEEKFLKMRDEMFGKRKRGSKDIEKQKRQFIEKHDLKEPQCIKCKKNDFSLVRTTYDQILLECIYCGSPFLLNADIVEGRAVLTFWTEQT